MKKKLKLLAAIFPLLLASTLVGCGNNSNKEIQQDKSTNLENQTSSSTNEAQNNDLKTEADTDENEIKELGPYKDIIKKHRKFVAGIAENNLNDDEYLEDPWANLRSHFSYLSKEKDLKKEACYALKDLNNNGKPELILLLDDYTIQAIYTLDKNNTPKLVDYYWERKHGYLIPNYGEEIGICSYGSSGAGNQEMELSTVVQDFGGLYFGDNPGLLRDERYVHDELKSGKVYPYYAVDTEFKKYETHYFYSNVEQTDLKPITEQDYNLAIEKYATTDQTQKVGLELKHLFT